MHGAVIERRCKILSNFIGWGRMRPGHVVLQQHADCSIEEDAVRMIAIGMFILIQGRGRQARGVLDAALHHVWNEITNDLIEDKQTNSKKTLKNANF